MMKAKKVFSGFDEDNLPTIGIPRMFIEEAMWGIEDVEEIQLLLKVFHDLEIQDGPFRYLRFDDLIQSIKWCSDWGSKGADFIPFVASTLQKLVDQGFLLMTGKQDEPGEETMIFLNTPMGRAAIEAISRGQWKYLEQEGFTRNPPSIPNIYKLYEQHIGLLTPMIAEILNEAEQTYPITWIEEAMRLAVENNKRSWRYVEAILKRWKEEGKGERKTGQNSEEVLRKYAEQWKKPSFSRDKK